MNSLEKLSKKEKIALDNFVTRSLGDYIEMIEEIPISGYGAREVIFEALVQVYLMGKENQIHPVER